MKEYNRFTHNPNNLEIASPCYLCKHKEERPIRNKQKCSMAECDYLKCYEKLAELEDKIENGTLIELPCKVGDDFYGIETNTIFKYSLIAIKLVENNEIHLCTVYDIEFILGKDAFLTKAEAEQKLKELQNER